METLEPKTTETKIKIQQMGSTAESGNRKHSRWTAQQMELSV